MDESTLGMVNAQGGAAVKRFPPHGVVFEDMGPGVKAAVDMLLGHILDASQNLDVEDTKAVMLGVHLSRKPHARTMPVTFEDRTDRELKIVDDLIKVYNRAALKDPNAPVIVLLDRSSKKERSFIFTRRNS